MRWRLDACAWNFSSMAIKACVSQETFEEECFPKCLQLALHITYLQPEKESTGSIMSLALT